MGSKVIFVFLARSCSISVFIWLMITNTKHEMLFDPVILTDVESTTLCCIIFNQSIAGLVTIEYETNIHYFCVLSSHNQNNLLLMQPVPHGPRYSGQVNQNILGLEELQHQQTTARQCQSWMSEVMSSFVHPECNSSGQQTGGFLHHRKDSVII